MTRHGHTPQHSRPRTWWLLPLAVSWFALMLTACKTKERTIVVPSVSTRHHWHTDSIVRTDSIVSERETVVMQLDSAQMAAYGIELKQAERAWLVRCRELERRLGMLSQTVTDRDTVRDTVPVPYRVAEYVEKPLTAWQRIRLSLANVALMLLGLCAVYVFFRLKRL